MRDKEEYLMMIKGLIHQDLTYKHIWTSQQNSNMGGTKTERIKGRNRQQ